MRVAMLPALAATLAWWLSLGSAPPTKTTLQCDASDDACYAAIPVHSPYAPMKPFLLERSVNINSGTVNYPDLKVGACKSSVDQTWRKTPRHVATK